jgi:hypothetical protein
MLGTHTMVVEETIYKELSAAQLLHSAIYPNTFEYTFL